MNEIDLTAVWWVNAAAAITLLLSAILLLRSWFKITLKPVWLFIVTGNMLILLLTPIAIPETSFLAPAWFSVLFEAIFGEPQYSLIALKLIALLLCLFNLLCASVAVLVYFARNRLNRT